MGVYLRQRTSKPYFNSIAGFKWPLQKSGFFYLYIATFDWSLSILNNDESDLIYILGATGPVPISTNPLLGAWSLGAVACIILLGIIKFVYITYYWKINLHDRYKLKLNRTDKLMRQQLCLSFKVQASMFSHATTLVT